MPLYVHIENRVGDLLDYDTTMKEVPRIGEHIMVHCNQYLVRDVIWNTDPNNRVDAVLKVDRDVTLS